MQNKPNLKLENTHNRNSDIRLYDLSVAKVKELIELFINKIGWRIVKDESSANDKYTIIAQNPESSSRKLFLNREPQITTWTLSTENEKTRIAILAGLTKKFRIWFYVVLIILLILPILFSILLDIFTTPSNPLSQAAVWSFWLAGFLFLLISACAYANWLLLSPKYTEYLEKFYNSIYQISRKHFVVISNGYGFPDTYKILLIFLIFLPPLVFIPVPYRPFGYVSLVSILIDISLLFLLFSLILFFLILAVSMYENEDVRVLFRFCIIGVTVGGALFVYILFPILFHSFGLGPFLAENLALKESLSLVTHSLIIAIPIIFFLFLIGALLLIFKGIFVITIAILRERVLYASVEPKSIFYKVFSWKHSFMLLSNLVTPLWFICSLVNMFGVYFSFGCLEYTLFGANYLLSNRFLYQFIRNAKLLFFFITENMRISHIVTRSTVLLYAFPIFAIFFIFAFRWVKNIREIYKLRQRKVPAGLKEIVKEIAAFSSIKEPRLVIIDSPYINSNTRYYFPIGNVMKVTSGAIEKLNKEELNALLAHELGHLKKHSIKYTFLDFLSQFTLFGSGFLATLQNSKLIEYEADDFCLEFLSKKNLHQKLLISLLQKTVVNNFLLKNLAPSDTLLSFTSNDVLFKKEHLKFKEKLKLLYEIFFGDLIISYIHPTIEERIKRIEAIT